MGPAPPLDCAVCGRRIGKTRTHLMLAPASVDRLICVGCAEKTPRGLHARFWPDCPHAWHDVWDHPGSHATRAAAARLLGLWP